MFLYAITDSRQLASSLGGRASALLRLTERWAAGGVDAIQIREKDLEAGHLERLTSQVLKVVAGSKTKVYLNGRVDVAIATGSEVHLPGGSLHPAQVRRIFAGAGNPPPRISIACHCVADVQRAGTEGAAMALLAPIFGKEIRSGQTAAGAPLSGLGLDVLREACVSTAAGNVPLQVLALGGVTAENARQCVEAGAAGVAGIRIFLSEQWRGL